VKTFNDFDLSMQVAEALSQMGFEEATPIQEKAVPVGLKGKDLIGQAHTGTGKTAAFGIVLAEFSDLKQKHIQGVVLTPTRELCVQVAEELNRIGQFKGVRALPIYGGQDIRRQLKALKSNPQIIVGTPGRLMDHMRRRTIGLNNISMVVLDEADEMLNMGFIEDIETILRDVPKDRQTLLFSATIPRQIQDLANRFMKEPEVIRIESKAVNLPSIDQAYMEVQENKKFDVLCRLLDSESPERAIVFGRTRRRVDELSSALSKRGYLAGGIHGDMPQAKRDRVMRQFREGAIEELVATDVAARGLDIEGVTHIYNFDIPQDPEWYTHRIGRTGRAGKEGSALTLVTPREMRHMRLIESMTKGGITRRPIPTITEAFEGQQQIAADQLLLTAEQNDIEKYKAVAEGLLDETDSVTLVAAALKILTKDSDRKTPVELTAERPVGTKQGGGKSKQSKQSNWKKGPYKGGQKRRGKQQQSKGYGSSKGKGRRG